MRSAFALALALALVAVAAPSAGADTPDPDRAKELARQAVDRAMGAGSDRLALIEAIELTKQAYDLDHDPLYLCNIGGFYRLLEDWPRADSFLGRCLQLLPATRPEEVSRFRAVLDEVGRKVAANHVAVLVDVRPPGAMVAVSTFGRDEAVPAPTLVWLPVGTHTITATVFGRAVRQRSIEITAGMLRDNSRQVVAIDVDSAAAATGRGGGTVQRVLKWTAIGAGVAAAGTFGLALAFRSAADGEPRSSAAFEDNNARFEVANIVAPVLAGVAVAATIGWFYQRSRASEGVPLIGLAPVSGGAIVTLELRR
jgi:hypothetical protein